MNTLKSEQILGFSSFILVKSLNLPDSMYDKGVITRSLVDIESYSRGMTIF